ncbi:hypothetical protein DKE41_019025 (plasmid) [Acinetobacter pittii]|nr:hypothetical protein DKE41_019025 [Acinetobacter pittii]
MKACIYLDESGDLGWNFNHPYRQGGSSRFLTIACVITPSEDVKRPKKLSKDSTINLIGQQTKKKNGHICLKKKK